MQTEKKIAAVILAAGGSTRMGQPKLSLNWHGTPLVRWVARMALTAGCSPVIIVTGAQPDLDFTSLENLPLIFAHNPDWESGQSSSVRTGIAALPQDIDAALVLLGDQPQIPLSVLNTLINAYYAKTPPPLILATAVGEERANPVLFDRSMFNALTSLEGDAGARTIFSLYPVELVPFQNAILRLDIDSPEDYQRLMEIPPPDLPSES